ncbi:hypothetical protein HMPREF2698_03110 [Corynebacterium sp. HMSC072A02]|nr:hypothetical protein HMPREF2698_03110 [Corynebacterium sp. HMSC072A02]
MYKCRTQGFHEASSGASCRFTAVVFLSVAPQDVNSHVSGLNAAAGSRIYEMDVSLYAEKALTAKSRGFNFGKPLNTFVEFVLSWHGIGNDLASMAGTCAILIYSFE